MKKRFYLEQKFAYHLTDIHEKWISSFWFKAITKFCYKFTCQDFQLIIPGEGFYLDAVQNPTSFEANEGHHEARDKIVINKK